jgi:hypothetical protein
MDTYARTCRDAAASVFTVMMLKHANKQHEPVMVSIIMEFPRLP